jgi:hypothetical protein
MAVVATGAVLPERQVPPAQRVLLALEPPGPETVTVVQVMNRQLERWNRKRG